MQSTQALEEDIIGLEPNPPRDILVDLICVRVCLYYTKAMHIGHKKQPWEVGRVYL